MMSTSSNTTTPPVIRVLVVDDSRLAQKYFRENLHRYKDIQLVGLAGTGEEALSLAATHRPHVVVLDIVLPDMEGEEVCARLTRQMGIPVIAVTSLDVAEVERVMRQAGASLVIPKKGLRPEHMDELVHYIRHVASQAPRFRNERPTSRGSATTALTQPPFPIVVIAASTGGPPILRKIFAALPATFPAPIAVVQHIVTGMIQETQRWLQEVTPLHVTIAEHNMPLRAGTIYLAPDNYHLTVTRYRVHTIAIASSDTVRPSADVLFSSAATAFGPWAIAVVLSGMGDDGAEGALRIRHAGGYVIVQDPSEAPIGSMPRAVIKRQAHHVILPAQDIPQHLVERVRQYIINPTEKPNP